MWFQLTAARRRLVLSRLKSWKPRVFQLTAARRRLDGSGKTFYVGKKFQLTAARRRLGGVGVIGPANRAGFNSQPPEGGWTRDVLPVPMLPVFQLTAARRRLAV